MGPEDNPCLAYAYSHAGFNGGFDMLDRPALRAESQPDGRASFNVYAVHSLFSTLLGDVVFALEGSNGHYLPHENSPHGGATFLYIPAGHYKLKSESVPDKFYTPSDVDIIVSNVGEATAEGMPADGYAVSLYPRGISIRKTDRFGRPLTGGLFSLSMLGKQPRFGLAINGVISFCKLPPGAYWLRENAPPCGYLRDRTNRVLIIRPDGSYSINGLGPNEAYWVNFPENTADFGIRLVGQPALANKEFILYVNRTNCEAVKGVVDSRGIVNFYNVDPGKYELLERRTDSSGDYYPIAYIVVTFSGSVSALDEFCVGSSRAEVVWQEVTHHEESTDVGEDDVSMFPDVCELIMSIQRTMNEWLAQTARSDPQPERSEYDLLNKYLARSAGKARLSRSGRSS